MASDTAAKLQALLRDPGRRQEDERFLRLAPHIKCADGLLLSVQASRTHYCTPRDNYGPWIEVEVGYPSAPIAELLPYMDGDPKITNPTETVYGYVPLDLVAEVIDAHGGISGVTPPHRASPSTMKDTP